MFQRGRAEWSLRDGRIHGRHHHRSFNPRPLSTWCVTDFHAQDLIHGTAPFSVAVDASQNKVFEQNEHEAHDLNLYSFIKHASPEACSALRLRIQP